MPSSVLSAARRALLAALAPKPARPKLPLVGIASGRVVAPVTYSVTPAVDVMTGKLCPAHRRHRIGEPPAPPGAGAAAGYRRLPLRLLIRMRIQVLRPNAGLVLRGGRGLRQRSDVGEQREVCAREQRLHFAERRMQAERRPEVRRRDRKQLGLRESDAGASRRARSRTGRSRRCRAGRGRCCRRRRRTGRRRRAPCSR